MKNILKNILIVILIVVICILLIKIFIFTKNFKLMYKIDQANLKYVGANKNFHIIVENTSYPVEEYNWRDDIYKKDGIVKSFSDDGIIYKICTNFEAYYFSKEDNTIEGCSTNPFNGFEHFLETYCRNIDKSEITTDNENYILTIVNFKYYFDKKTYLLSKTELYNTDTEFDETHIIWRQIYTYNENETITDEIMEWPPSV